MSFWIAVVLLMGLTLFMLSLPFWRKGKEDVERAEYDLNVFRDQLKELERDLERGLISREEAETARIEIQRRLLTADEKRQGHVSRDGRVGRSALIFGLCAALAIVGGSLAFYGKIGKPGYGDMPFASRDFDKERQIAREKGVKVEIARLKEHLAKSPDDVDAWLMLGRVYRMTGQSEEGLKAYETALKASGRHPDILVDYAEMRIFAHKGEVDDETKKALNESLAADPMQFKGRFYLGYTQAKSNDLKGAVQTWTDLLAMAPVEAPWMEQVRKQITMAAKAGGFDPSEVKPTAQARVMAKQFALEWENEQKQTTAQAQDDQGASMPGPTREQMQDAAKMSAGDRTEMIRSMVKRLADRLKENPDDLEGWKRLVKVYGVLGEKEKAREAQKKVDELSTR